MNKYWNIALILLIAIFLLAGCVTSGKFQGKEKFKGTVYGTEDEIELTGKIYKPEGKGPFPAVVMLHRCNGIESIDNYWASKFKSWGYVAFVIDSLGPRNRTSTCWPGASPGNSDRAMDAYSAKDYLSKLPFVISDKIAVIGWSDGGKTTLVAVDNKFYGMLPPERKDPFTAAVAFYPYCPNIMDNLNAPLLILIGEKDDWTPASECLNRMPMGKTKHEVNLKIYEGAHHAFDVIGKDKTYLGHTLKYDYKVTKEAEVETKLFLEKYLK